MSVQLHRDIKNPTVLHQVQAKNLNFNIEIKHGFSCINDRQVLRETLKTEGRA